LETRDFGAVTVRKRTLDFDVVSDAWVVVWLLARVGAGRREYSSYPWSRGPQWQQKPHSLHTQPLSRHAKL